MFKFDGITVFQLEDTRDKFDWIYDSDCEILIISKKTYQHREEGLNFDYKYAISAFNMWFVADDDEQFNEDNAYDVGIYLIVSPDSLDEKIREEIKEAFGGYCDYQDIFFHGMAVRLVHDNHPMDGVEDYMYKVGNIIEPLDFMRGFYLDRPVNKIGSTGWDLILNCLDGKSFIERTLERM